MFTLGPTTIEGETPVVCQAVYFDGALAAHMFIPIDAVAGVSLILASTHQLCVHGGVKFMIIADHEAVMSTAATMNMLAQVQEERIPPHIIDSIISEIAEDRAFGHSEAAIENYYGAEVMSHIAGCESCTRRLKVIADAIETTADEQS